MRPRKTNGCGPFRPPGGIWGWSWWQARAVDHSFLPSANEMDIRYNHGSLIHCLRASHSQDAPDLLAVGGEHSIAILQVVSRFKIQNFATACINSRDQLETTAMQIATFNVGCRITGIAWSSRTVSPSFSDDWSIE